MNSPGLRLLQRMHRAVVRRSGNMAPNMVREFTHQTAYKAAEKTGGQIDQECLLVSGSQIGSSGGVQTPFWQVRALGPTSRWSPLQVYVADISLRSGVRDHLTSPLVGPAGFSQMPSPVSVGKMGSTGKMPAEE